MNTPHRNGSVNVIVADDDGTTRMALRLLLQEQLYTVVGEAADGEKAVELCEHLRPDIVFLDIDMPKMNGTQAAARIREVNSHIGIVIVSGISTLDNVLKAMEAGVNGFIVKPFSRTKLAEAINNCPKKHQ